MAIALTVSDVTDHKKVLSRATFTIDPSASAAETKVRFQQTTNRMSREITKKRERTTATLLKKIDRVFVQLFGVAESQAALASWVSDTVLIFSGVALLGSLITTGTIVVTVARGKMLNPLSETVLFTGITALVAGMGGLLIEFWGERRR